jgi:hypothetical protein
MEKGKYAEACPKLARSQELAPTGGTLFALADCYEKNGQIASAWVAYKEAADRAAAAKRSDAESKAAEGAKRLEPRISKVVVQVPPASAADGLVVKRDGKPISQAEYGIAVPLDPGTHTIDASAPGRKPWSTRVTVGREASQKTLVVPALEADPLAAKDEAPPASSSSGGTLRVVGLAIAGVGLVGVGVGAVFGLQAKSKNDDAASHCRDATHCDQTGLDLDQKARDAATISTIGFVAGGALLVGGTILFFAAPKSTVTVGVNGTPGGARATLGAAF